MITASKLRKEAFIIMEETPIYSRITPEVRRAYQRFVLVQLMEMHNVTERRARHAVETAVKPPAPHGGKRPGAGKRIQK
jgi:hypothetical protein